MNNDFIIQSLLELKEHIDSTIDEVKNGQYEEDGDLSFSVELEHFVEHIIMSWHCRNMTWNDINKMTYEEYENMSFSIPKFHSNYQLVELEE